ncbi:hypothetical protein [Patulibacter defluvii]|uniref:hypothetical protein n=1 Tax=Patulibacter defluvii TaxID=3095358 RepID=UPI002A764DB0|nr:hypothetical protein [Patulibacter sp. DM4]
MIDELEQLDLIRTARFRPRYELRGSSGAAIGSLAWTGAPGRAEARVGERSWTLRPATGRSRLEAWRDEQDLELHLDDGEIVLAERPAAPMAWRRGGSAPGAGSISAARLHASLRPHRRTAPGFAVTLAGDLPERELVLLTAAFELLR